MEIWIIQDGEKTGPFHDFEIRQKIDNGEVNADTRAWHGRMEAWTPLGEIDLFHRAFTRSEATPPPPAESDAPDVEHSPHLTRRFWARWLDLYLYSGVWWLLMWLAGRDIGQLLTHPWIMLLHYVPWFAIEAWMIHRFATTPGKWLLNLRVLNLDGSRLSLRASTVRSARVLFMGIGFGLQGLSLLCQFLGWITTKSLGRPLWDRAGDHFLDGTPPSRRRIAGYAAVFLFSIWLQMIVIAPYVMDVAAKNFPQHAEEFKKNPPWHLPVR